MNDIKVAKFRDLLAMPLVVLAGLLLLAAVRIGGYFTSKQILKLTNKE